jgi:hypothetical protein
MPQKDVEASIAYCLGRLIRQEGDRLYQGRVRRDVADELEFREGQAVVGRKGGLERARRVAQGKPSEPQRLMSSPPAPAPSPDARRQAIANPLFAGKRPAFESECLRLVARMSELTGEDPLDVIARASGFEGAKRTAINPATMTDDRLANTVRDLRADVAAEERKAAAKGPKAVTGA